MNPTSETGRCEPCPATRPPARVSGPDSHPGKFQAPKAASSTSRRCLLQTLALAASGCATKSAPKPSPLVSITRAPEYNNSLYGTFRLLLSEHKLDLRGKQVLLKPNLVEFDPGAAINTHPLVVHAAVEAFRSLGAASVRIAEGPGHRRITLDLADAAGYFSTIPDFERLFTDLNLDEVSRVSLRRPVSKLREIYLSRTALNADLIVSLPKMKTHHWVGATLSMKNFFGLVPGAVYGWPKNILHWAGINECIADLYRVFPRRFAIVDGIEGMEGNGPIQGQRKHAGLLVAGADLVAVDSTACRLMCIDPRKVHYLRLAENQGQTLEGNVRQIGDPLPLGRTPFALIPEFQPLRLDAGTACICPGDTG